MDLLIDLLLEQTDEPSEAETDLDEALAARCASL